MSQNIDSFMAVVNATQQDEKGIFLPGDWFPSGRPLRAEGSTKADLDTNRDMAEQWHEIARSKYEREVEERDQAASRPEVPRVDTQRTDPAPRDDGRNAPAEARPVQTLEEELQGRCTFWRERCERLEWEKGVIVKDLAEASKQLLKTEAALDAIRDEE